MKRRNRALVWLVPATGIVVPLSGAPAASAQSSGPGTGGSRRTPFRSPRSTRPRRSTTWPPPRRSEGDAAVVGLGESVHGTAEETALKLRTLRFLVERMGFRSIAWEEDWTMGLKIDEYVRTGKGDADALARAMSFQYRTGEVADVLRWLRDYNATHDDKVRFVGVEYYFTRPMADDAVDAYVAKAALDRLPELRKHLKEIRPSTDDMPAYATWFDQDVTDKRPYVRHARRVRELVENLPHRQGDREHALALHYARQIESFYVHFTLGFNEQNAYRDAHAAEPAVVALPQRRRQGRLLGGERAHGEQSEPAHHRAGGPGPPLPDGRKGQGQPCRTGCPTPPDAVAERPLVRAVPGLREPGARRSF